MSSFCCRTTPLISRGSAVSYEVQKAYMPPRSAAADGSAPAGEPRPASTHNRPVTTSIQAYWMPSVTRWATPTGHHHGPRPA